MIFRFGLWPAALELWGIAPSDPRARELPRRAGRTASSRSRVLRRCRCRRSPPRAHARNYVTGAMTHSFSRWAWSRARFQLSPASNGSSDIDALALRRGDGKFERLDRISVKFPPTDNNRIGVAFTSLCGTLVRVEIERATGALRIAKAYSVFECGQALVPEVVLGQAQGGFAMGVGYALLEIAAALRGRTRQRPVESRAVSDRARLRPAAARSRDRDAAAAAERGAEGHGGGRDDPGRAGAA